MKIIFTNHAKFKFEILERHGFKISENQIRDIARNPAKTNHGTKGRIILQGQFDDAHIVRVICEGEGEELKIITFYPARKGRYENQLQS